MPEIQAVLLDSDGTIRNSVEVINDAIQYAFGQQGIHLTEDDIRPYAHGLPAAHKAFGGDIPYEIIRDDYYRRQEETHHSIELYPGVREAIVKIKHRGWQLGMVSSSSFVQKSLKADGLFDYFDAVIGGTMVTRLKPDKEPVELTLSMLGCDRRRAVLAGDLDADIRAGKAAQLLATIGLTHGFGTREMLETAGADHIIDSFAELIGILDIIGRR